MASVAVAALAGAPSALADNWLTFHGNAMRTGVSGETGINTSTVGAMSLRWAAGTGAATFSSPTVDYDGKLKTTVVYTASTNGKVEAFRERNGKRVWTYSTGGQIQGSPTIYGGAIYVGSANGYVYKLNRTTGALECQSPNLGGRISGSPLVVDPDGVGPTPPTVYIGQNGPTGNADGGSFVALSTADCSVSWSFSSFGSPEGSETASVWSSPAFGTTATGEPVVVFGSGDPDDAVYALDAVTGAEVWRFQTAVTSDDADVGASAVISPPGANGFVDGVAYIAGKDNHMYAIDLTTGAQDWVFDVMTDSPSAMANIVSSAALDGAQLYFGYGQGIYDLNATTGTKVWKSPDAGLTTGTVLVSPAVVGPAGQQVVLFGDQNGFLYGVSAATGAELWTYNTGKLVWSSPAIAHGRVFEGSASGKLLAFGLS